MGASPPTLPGSAAGPSTARGGDLLSHGSSHRRGPRRPPEGKGLLGTVAGGAGLAVGSAPGGGGPRALPAPASGGSFPERLRHSASIKDSPVHPFTPQRYRLIPQLLSAGCRVDLRTLFLYRGTRRWRGGGVETKLPRLNPRISLCV